ncbi:hypothetical protein SAMN04515671_4496 [Nakamurella panacisegetis]|uniref:DUF4352 domain-containing protein n=1 Tax=Nakamurella panacisegetis TaxID=1090615 RepID=A0A1H0T6N7_9ACTN|nr:hypothetical protein [Nakamurella panacisegetis]SDP49707.1 hypothetical protein SAMN04515671_4496 [Nakamurella panacisegetis]
MIPARDAGRATVRRPRRLIATVALAAAAMFVAGCSNAPATTEPAYGSLPTYLPTAAIQPDSVLTGSAAHPALTTQGDQVEVRLGNGKSVRATVSGPDVPGEGLPYVSPATTCTWTITLDRATATVPIDLHEFTTIDHLGGTYRLALAPGQSTPPAAIGPGQTVAFRVRTRMETGEGLMRWAPGNSVVASWDFVVEND